jgi:hypothetical protein
LECLKEIFFGASSPGFWPIRGILEEFFYNSKPTGLVRREKVPSLEMDYGFRKHKLISKTNTCYYSSGTNPEKKRREIVIFPLIIEDKFIHR